MVKLKIMALVKSKKLYAKKSGEQFNVTLKLVAKAIRQAKTLKESD
jgi:hypothetical protein